MKNILFLNQNEESGKALAEITEELTSEIMEEIKLLSFEKEEDAYACLNTFGIDLFLVGIRSQTEEAEDDAGLRFVRKIREMERCFYTPVVLISPDAQPEPFVYTQLHCYACIKMPFSEHEMKNVLRSALDMPLRKAQDSYYYIKKNGIVYVIKFSDFVYARAVKRHLEIGKKNGQKLTIKYMPLKKLKRIFCDTGFIQCNRNCIVNRKYIKHIDMDNQKVVLWDGRDLIEIEASYDTLLKIL